MASSRCFFVRSDADIAAVFLHKGSRLPGCNAPLYFPPSLSDLSYMCYHITSFHRTRLNYCCTYVAVSSVFMLLILLKNEVSSPTCSAETGATGTPGVMNALIPPAQQAATATTAFIFSWESGLKLSTGETREAQQQMTQRQSKRAQLSCCGARCSSAFSGGVVIPIRGAPLLLCTDGNSTDHSMKGRER